MALSRLYCQHIRCLESEEIQPGPKVNIIHGENGAGKTSFLEAIHILSTGRSFRTPNIKEIIQHDQTSLVVAGSIKRHDNLELKLGIQRWKDKTKARINQQAVKHIASLSAELPVIAFNPVSHRLVTEDPSERRSYLDWGVFQIYPEFLDYWRQYRRSLKQRNKLLKDRKPTSEIILWDKQLAETAEKIHQQRLAYFSTLEEKLPLLTKQFSLPFELHLGYRPGWKTETHFSQILQDNIKRDTLLGYTYSGPHRADLKIMLDNFPAASVASRGQLKLVTILLKLLQAQHYHDHTQKNAILLLDDLPSEFDGKHLSETCRFIENMKSQIFVSMVEPGQSLFNATEVKMFHVEHGKVSEE